MVISEESVVVAVREQVSSSLGGEAVVLSLKDGMYYGLNSVGSRIWNMLQQPVAVCEMREVLLNEYTVEPERCTRELLAILRQLADRQLIVTVNGAPE